MKILFHALKFIKNMRCGVCSAPLIEGSYAFRKMSQFRSKPNWILIGSKSISRRKSHKPVRLALGKSKTYISRFFSGKY